MAPAGVFVVDAKRYQGLIRIRDVGGFFKRDDRLFVGSRDRSKLAEAMGRQVEAVERALRAVPVDPLPPDALPALRDGGPRRRGLQNLLPRRTAVGGRAAALAADLADAAREVALDLLGDTAGAVAIAERRLRSEQR